MDGDFLIYLRPQWLLVRPCTLQVATAVIGSIISLDNFEYPHHKEKALPVNRKHIHELFCYRTNVKLQGWKTWEVYVE